MKVAEVEIRVEAVPLTRPYTIAYKSVDAVRLISLRLRTDDGREGFGSASPASAVTGETLEAATAALDGDRLRGLLAAAPDDAREAARALEGAFETTPAAGAALDMALLDAWAKAQGRPLADALGRAHEALPTSITIGIKDAAATLEEAAEYVGRGFRTLKVKVGRDPDEDVERIARLREVHGDGIVIRVDPNQGYTPEQLVTFLRRSGRLGVELVEQPLAVGATEQLLRLPEETRRRIALDESVQRQEDARRWAREPRPAGIYNIKLMKCGGVTPALEIARIAAEAGIDLMWGCMDESRASIAAALHAALACPNTRYLDLDGSLDLARDFAEGGFQLEEGVMRTTDAPGLGVRFV
jgi:L-Ala-D/L-Glu epimerase